MTPQRWNEVKALLAEALEATADERAALLAAADPELARQVESYLALDTELGDFIERPLFDLHDDVDPSVRVGERLGPYRLAREIGSGGMGAVYQAVRADEEYEQSVAIKVLKRGLDTAEVIHRFRNERQILAGLEHPHVARLLDGGTTADGRPYLVMEYVEGERIDVWCAERGLTVDERLALFLAVCEGVKFAHRNLVVHRDLKPSNILITEEGAPKLLDFGIARLLDSEGPSLPTVGAWRFLTPEYASPEQVTGQPITTATDVYSLGILLYLLLTDRRPYELEERSARGLAALLERGVEPPKPSAVAPEERRKRLRGDLDNIALTALRIEPERRYGNAGELADDVRRHLEGLPVRATPDSWRYRAGKFVQRHRVGVAAAAAIALLLVAFAVTATVLTRQARHAQDRAEQEAARAELQRVRAVETLTFLEDLISRADPDRDEGGDRTVRELLDEATEALIGPVGEDSERVIQDPWVRASLLQTIGRAYLSQGSPDEAQRVLEEALAIRLAILEESDTDLAETMSSLAQTHFQKRELEEAEQLMRRAMALVDDESDAMRGLSNIAQLRFLAGQYELCEKLNREVLDRKRALAPNTLTLATSLHNLGNCILRQQDAERAEPYLTEALKLRKSLGEEPTSTARTLNSVANVLEAKGDAAGAVTHYEDAEAILTERDPIHPGLPSILNNMGLLRWDLGETGEAEVSLRRAIEISDARNPNNPNRWYYVRNLAALLLAEGSYEKAEELVTQLKVAWSNETLDEWRRADLRSIGGGLLAARSSFQEAEPVLLQSYDDLLTAKPPAHPRNIHQARERIVRLYEAWGKPDEAARWRAAQQDEPEIAPIESGA